MKFRKIFSVLNSTTSIAGKYNSISDFFRHASESEKMKIFTAAAKASNEEQLKTFNEAKIKLKTASR